MRLRYLVKLKIRVLVKSLMLEKTKVKKCYLLTLISLIKNATLRLRHHVMATLIKNILYQTLSKSASFYNRYNKNILVCSFGSQF